jgi:hypothetical protein
MDRILWSRILVILGLFGMLVGALDPLEGSVIVLPCAGLAALGAFIGQTARRKLLYLAFLLIAVGVCAMLLYGFLGRSSVWAAMVIPYPIGWILAIVASILFLVETFRQRSAAA